METETLTPEPSAPLEVFREQLNILLVFLDRPLVQVQVFAVGIVFLIALGIELFARQRIDRLLARLVSSRELPRNLQRLYRLLTAMRHVNFSLSSLLLLLATIFFFERLGQPTSILRVLLPIVLILLAYQIFVAVLYLRFKQNVIEPIHKYAISPLFILTLSVFVLGSFVDLERVGSIILFNAFGIEITVGRVVQVSLVIYAIFVIAFLLQKTTDQVMKRSNEPRAGAIASVLVIVRFLVLVSGAFLLAGVLGIDASTLALIGGGLAVGIGTGLQNIVANFVSGIILIFEQSLRPGDVIDIDGQLGVVNDLNVRATTIRTNDNVDLVIPNERFFSSQVVTYTKENPLVRVELPFGVSYNSDPKVVRELAVNTAVRHGLASSKQAPTVQFMGFGASSLDFRLLVWMEKPQRIPVFRSDLYFMLWDTFKDHNIQIPFPQRDLNIGSGWQQVFGEPPPEDTLPPSSPA